MRRRELMPLDHFPIRRERQDACPAPNKHHELPLFGVAVRSNIASGTQRYNEPLHHVAMIPVQKQMGALARNSVRL